METADTEGAWAKILETRDLVDSLREPISRFLVAKISWALG